MKPTFATILTAIGVLFSIASNAQEHTIAAEKLGMLTANVEAVEQISTYSGHPLTAQMTPLTGQGYTIRTPFNLWRVEFLKMPGEQVKKEEAFVELMGPEAHHYYEQYQLKKTLFEQTELFYENNRKLFDKKAIGEQAWLEINKQYVALKLEMGEYHHFFDYVHHFDEVRDVFVLKAPADGMVRYSAFEKVSEGEEIASIIPSNAVRLMVSLPSTQTSIPSSVQTQNCRLKIDFAETVINQFYKRIWTEPVDDSCNLSFGEIVSVTPEYATTAFLVSKTALFDLQGNSYIWIKQGNNFSSVKVEILTSANDKLVVSSKTSLSGAMALTSSVSAMQGILMGLGE